MAEDLQEFIYLNSKGRKKSRDRKKAGIKITPVRERLITLYFVIVYVEKGLFIDLFLLFFTSFFHPLFYIPF